MHRLPQHREVRPGLRVVLIRRHELEHTVTPSPTNQLGVKGVGEAGTIGSAPAVINAIVDALADLGVRDVPMPASPLNVWNTLLAARRDRTDAESSTDPDHHEPAKTPGGTP